MSDDLERTLHDSLSRHAARIGRPTGTIETVYARVTRRRTRRRAVAGFGSLAVAAVGVIGIATVGRDGGGAPAAQGDGEGNAWACSGFLGGAGDTTYYTDCRRVDDVPVTTVVCAPASTAPVTWVDTTYAQPVVDVTGEACTASGTLPAPTDTTPPSPCLPTATAAPTTAVSMTTPTQPETTAIYFISNCEPHEQVYTVQRGDSVYGISALFGVEPDVLARYNSWPEGINHGLEPGDMILIPPGSVKAASSTVPVTDAPPATTPVTTIP